MDQLTRNIADGAAFEQALQPESRLRGVAVVGLGYWGPNWVRNLYHLQCADRVVACDLDEERRRRVEMLYPGVETAAGFDEVIGDPDIEAVVIATPVNTHFEIASRCLKAGKSTLVEKPLATSCEQAEVLIRMARERDLTLMAGHTFEYSAPVMKIRELIDSGELGDIFNISSVRANLGIVSPRRQRGVGPGDSRHLDHPDVARPDAAGSELPGRKSLSRSHRGCRASHAALCQQRDRLRARKLARSEQDSADDDRRLAQDAGVRRHGAAGKDPRLRQGRRPSILTTTPSAIFSFRIATAM